MQITRSFQSSLGFAFSLFQRSLLFNSPTFLRFSSFDSEEAIFLSIGSNNSLLSLIPLLTDDNQRNRAYSRWKSTGTLDNLKCKINKLKSNKHMQKVDKYLQYYIILFLVCWKLKVTKFHTASKNYVFQNDN